LPPQSAFKKPQKKKKNAPDLDKGHLGQIGKIEYSLYK